MSTARSVTVKLLDKEYTINCPEGAEAEVIASADHLNGIMREIRTSGRIVGLERIAIMAALNVSHELIKARESLQQQGDEARMRRLQDKIERTLSASRRGDT